MSLASWFLIALLAVPFVAALVVAALGAKRACHARWVALVATLVDLVLAGFVTVTFLETREQHPLDPATTKTFAPEFVPGSAESELVHNQKKDTRLVDSARRRTTWNLVTFAHRGAVQFYLGIDGLNVWLVLLTAILMVPAVLVSWKAIDDRANEFYAWLLVLGGGMLGVFLAFDLLLFYVFFELTLVPLFFLIGMWGGPERRHAARKFFVYTLAGSVITFLGLLAVVLAVYHRSAPRVLTFSIPELVLRTQELMQADPAFWRPFQLWIFAALFAGFAIKVPLFPMHTWLPLAHVEAPTAGSVLLAGVLLKMGTYGFLRLALPLAPDACLTLGVPLIGTLATVGILYGAFCSLAQDDIKKLIAYSSVSHLGYCMLGMFALNEAGLAGSVLQMINHGVSTGGLFLVVGMLYERYHTRKIADYGGIGTKLKLLTFCMAVVCMSSVGLPGLNGFPGEALVFFGMFKTSPILAVVSAGGILLGAWYLLSMLKSVFFGPLKEPGSHAGHHGKGHGDHHGKGHGHDESHADSGVRDLDGREIATLAPILGLCLLLGVFPQPVLQSTKPELTIVTNLLDARRRALQNQPELAPPPRKVALAQ